MDYWRKQHEYTLPNRPLPEIKTIIFSLLVPLLDILYKTVTCSFDITTQHITSHHINRQYCQFLPVVQVLRAWNEK
jgi:hypothetical protein